MLLIATTAESERWTPFHLPRESPEGSVTDARFLLDATAGKHGFIKVRDGHFYLSTADAGLACLRC